MPAEADKGDEGQHGDEGYMLLAVLVLVFMVLLTLSVAAPRIATQLKRDRELETQHRAQQYTRAIRLYYRKFKSYPGSIDQLEKSNNQRFLRQRYLDPMTGKDDWKLIHVGENKTKVKGFFGEDLPGIGGGLGAAAGLQGGSGPGQNPIAGPGTGSAFNNNGGTNNPGGLNGTPGTGVTGTGTTGTGTGTPGVGSQDATTFTGGAGGQIMGVGVPVSGDAILTVNEQTQYDQWEFLYDPRIEQQYNKGALQGAGGAGAGGGLGNGLVPSGAPGTGASPFGTTPTTPPTTPNPGVPVPQ